MHKDAEHKVEQTITEKMLGLVVFAAFVEKTAKWDSDETRRVELIPQHINYFIELEKQGKVLLAGPFIEEKDRPDGLLIFSVETKEEAEALMAKDVFIAEGFRTVTVRPWLLNEGHIQLNLRLSNTGFTMG